MEKFKFLKKEKISSLPKTPGVYVFKKVRKGLNAKHSRFLRKEEFLYIGKAINIKERIKNHFQKSNYKDNIFIDDIEKIGYIKTDSGIEALILEANLIKKHKPKYNVAWRDDKNYFFVAITKENYPRVFWTHQTKSKNIQTDSSPPCNSFGIKKDVKYIGPFVDGTALKKTLKLLRKVFPYYTRNKHPKNLCTWCHLGLCPGPDPVKKEYKKNINNLIAVLKGKRKSVLINLKKEMVSFSKSQNYERAAEIRDKITAFENILSHAKFIRENPPASGRTKNWKNIEKELKKILNIKKQISRMEAYDISNIQGQKAAGSMITFINGYPDKNFYRKFKIKISGKPNDVAMIKEVLDRRFSHSEWELPDLILIDGGIAQLNAVIKSKNKKRETKNIKVISLAKREDRLHIENRKKQVLLKNLPREIFNLILKMRDESHRFAINYHKKLRLKDLIK